ncbi:MAG: Glycine rich protein, partial [Pseudonocardiales bacterium]|nr:Glycine rich protein [Pseudonocardiales bacterium]
MSRLAIRRIIGVVAAVLALTLSASSMAVALPTGPSSSAVDCTIKPASAKDSEPVPPQGSEPEPTNLQKFLSSLVENAGSTAGSDGAGWVMNLILGKSGNQSPTPGEQEILKELGAQKTQLDTLQSSVNALANQLTSAQFAIQSQLTQSTYDELVGSASSNIAKIQSAVQEMCYLSAESRVYAPDGTDVARIQDIRENALGWLNALSAALVGINSQGIFEVYSEATWNALAPGATQQPNRVIFTPRYLASMKSLLAYYTSLAAQLFNVYSEAVHWQSDAHGAVPAVDLDNTDKIAQFNAQLVVYLNSWSKAATLDITGVAEGTVVDTRTVPMSIWTSTPAALAGVPSDRYCVSVVPLCLGKVWASDGKTQLATRIVPSVAPVAAYVTAQFPGKHVPTTKEWASLLGDTAHGATASAGVANWATANAFPILESRSYTTPTGPAQTVPPVVAADGQVLTFNETPYAQPIAEKGENATGYAGYLAVVSPQVTAAPYKAGIVSGVPADDGVAVARDAATPIATTASDGTQAAPTPTVGTLGQTTAFSAVGCAAGAYQQPVGANAVKVTVRGASGGASKGERGHNLAGGGGAVVSATIPLGAGGVVYPQIGGRGQASQPFQQPGGGGFGGGGTGGRAGGTTSSVPGTGGGGMSGISADAECNEWLVVAGGGGGAGALWAEDGGGEGGSGCIVSGCAGHPVTTDGGGAAGTRITGGAGGASGGTKAGAGANGALYQGGEGGAAGANA